MLVELKKDETLIIKTLEGKLVEVSLTQVGLKSVKLGFVDPGKATVYRKELWQDIKAGKAKIGWI